MIFTFRWAHNVVMWWYHNWFINQTYKNKLPNWEKLILPELLRSEALDVIIIFDWKYLTFKDSGPSSNKKWNQRQTRLPRHEVPSFFKFLLRLDVKISCVAKPSHTEESALLLPLKELYWELYYAHLKSKISDYEQLTGQLKAVKSFTCNTPKILKCSNI